MAIFREYWKILSHGAKGIQSDWCREDTDQQLWRLALCVRCQSRNEGLSLLRNDPQRRLLDKTMYALILYYSFTIVWDDGDLLATTPNGIGL